MALSTTVAAWQQTHSRTGQQMVYWLLAAIVMLLPVQWFLLPMNLALADVALMLLILLTLVQWLAGRRQVVLPLLGPMLLIWAASALGTGTGFRHMSSVIAIVQEIYIFAWFVALVSQLRTLTPQQQDRLLKLWAIVACIEAVTLVLGMMKIGPAMFYTKPSQDVVTTEGLTRAVGLHANSNAAGVYMSVSYFTALAANWPGWRRWLTAAWIYAGMFGTGSNGALLSSLVGTAVLLAVYTILTNRSRMRMWGALLPLGIGGVALLFLTAVLLPVGGLFGGVDTGNQFLFYTIGRFSHSLASRLEIIDWSWRIYQVHPFGVGPNGFSTLQGSLHNDYAAFWFERGLLGLLGWLWLVGATLWAAMRALPGSARSREDRWRCWMVVALGAGFFACAINAFSHEISHMRQLWLQIVSISAVSDSCKQRFLGVMNEYQSRACD